mmetsp:Transcript_65669/g.189336  ORF Transcript_65669/g.189336 Transcript_65669/m.189336 type:complete len:317 (-) Transcript_65669:223-1173(-)
MRASCKRLLWLRRPVKGRYMFTRRGKLLRRASNKIGSSSASNLQFKSFMDTNIGAIAALRTMSNACDGRLLLSLEPPLPLPPWTLCKLNEVGGSVHGGGATSANAKIALRLPATIGLLGHESDKPSQDALLLLSDDHAPPTLPCDIFRKDPPLDEPPSTAPSSASALPPTHPLLSGLPTLGAVEHTGVDMPLEPRRRGLLGGSVDFSVSESDADTADSEPLRSSLSSTSGSVHNAVEASDALASRVRLLSFFATKAWVTRSSASPWAYWQRSLGKGHFPFVNAVHNEVLVRSGTCESSSAVWAKQNSLPKLQVPAM